MVRKQKIEKLFAILLKNKIKICVAESITGGRFTSEIIKFPGASKIIDYSIVCYSNESKKKFLKIDKQIKKNGVVSSEVAKLMVKNLTQFSKSKKILAISCTGYAGPVKNNIKDKVGNVFIGIKFKKKIFTVEKNFKFNNRLKIINATTKEMINIALDTIQE